MDKEQQNRFKRAVERKAQESENASEASEHGARRPEGDRDSASRVQDVTSVRERSTRHKKVTAEKWNQ